MVTIAAICILRLQSGVTPAAKVEAQPIHFVEYLAGFHSPVDEAKRWVITSQEEFQAYWAEGLGRDPKDTPKIIDFRRNGLVAVHIGARASSGYNVFIKSVTKSGPDMALVTYVEQKPRPLTVVMPMRISPWVLFKVPAGLTKFTYKEIVQTIKYPPVRDDAQPGKPDPDSQLHPSG